MRGDKKHSNTCKLPKHYTFVNFRYHSLSFSLRLYMSARRENVHAKRTNIECTLLILNLY